jgi:hypothetical protein
MEVLGYICCRESFVIASFHTIHMGVVSLIADGDMNKWQTGHVPSCCTTVFSLEVRNYVTLLRPYVQ